MNQESWNKFTIKNSAPVSFLQSWEWGEFQEQLGNKIYRLSLPSSSVSPPPVGEDKGGGEAGLQAQIIVHKLPLGRTYLEIPKGPILEKSKIKNQNAKVWEELINKLRIIGQKEKAVLARINPPYPSLQMGEAPLSPLLASFGGKGKKGEEVWRKPEILTRQTEPEDTILVDLSKSEDELLQNMHEKSRYNIRLAQRKGVTVRIATDDKTAFEKFLKLLEETAKRDRITSWPHERFWKFREKFMNIPSPRAELLIGEYQGQILAAAIIMFFGNAATYLYAASSGDERSANVPSLVLWEAIKLAKARGKNWYDMWGIAPAQAGKDHPWSGISRFKSRYVKLGVTGREFSSIGALDLVLDKPIYWLFKFGKKFFSLKIHGMV